MAELGLRLETVYQSSFLTVTDTQGVALSCLSSSRPQPGELTLLLHCTSSPVGSLLPPFLPGHPYTQQAVGVSLLKRKSDHNPSLLKTHYSFPWNKRMRSQLFSMAYP